MIWTSIVGKKWGSGRKNSLDEHCNSKANNSFQYYIDVDLKEALNSVLLLKNIICQIVPKCKDIAAIIQLF